MNCRAIKLLLVFIVFIAAVRTDSGEIYRYPFTMSFIKEIPLCAD